MNDEKLYSKAEVDAIVIRHDLELEREQKERALETGLADLRDRIDRSNSLKEDLIRKFEDHVIEDSETKREILAKIETSHADAMSAIPLTVNTYVRSMLKTTVGRLVAVFGVVYPVAIVVVDHVWK